MSSLPCPRKIGQEKGSQFEKIGIAKGFGFMLKVVESSLAKLHQKIRICVNFLSIFS